MEKALFLFFCRGGSPYPPAWWGFDFPPLQGKAQAGRDGTLPLHFIFRIRFHAEENNLVQR
jgi:hypothetical protein